MPCPNINCHKIYNKSGSSIYTQNCDISNSQLLFIKTLSSFRDLDLSTRKDNGINKWRNRCKRQGHNKDQLSHMDVINIQKSRSYYDPRSFRKLKK